MIYRIIKKLLIPVIGIHIIASNSSFREEPEISTLEEQIRQQIEQNKQNWTKPDNYNEVNELLLHMRFMYTEWYNDTSVSELTNLITYQTLTRYINYDYKKEIQSMQNQDMSPKDKQSTLTNILTCLKMSQLQTSDIRHAIEIAKHFAIGNTILTLQQLLVENLILYSTKNILDELDIVKENEALNQLLIGAIADLDQIREVQKCLLSATKDSAINIYPQLQTFREVIRADRLKTSLRSASRESLKSFVGAEGNSIVSFESLSSFLETRSPSEYINVEALDTEKVKEITIKKITTVAPLITKLMQIVITCKNCFDSTDDTEKDFYLALEKIIIGCYSRLQPAKNYLDRLGDTQEQNTDTILSDINLSQIINDTKSAISNGNNAFNLDMLSSLIELFNDFYLPSTMNIQCTFLPENKIFSTHCRHHSMQSLIENTKALLVSKLNDKSTHPNRIKEIKNTIDIIDELMTQPHMDNINSSLPQTSWKKAVQPGLIFGGISALVFAGHKALLSFNPKTPLRESTTTDNSTNLIKGSK